MSRRPTILIHNADLPSLVCLALQPDPSSLILWHVITDDPAASRRRDVIHRLAHLFSVRDVCALPASILHTLPRSALKQDLHTQHLIAAALMARELRAPRLISPLQIALDFLRVAAAVDSAGRVASAVNSMGSASWRGAPLASTLHSAASLTGLPVCPLEIILPIVDLTDARLVELAAQLLATIDIWPCTSPGPAPCAVCQPCRRWLPALAAVNAHVNIPSPRDTPSPC